MYDHGHDHPNVNEPPYPAYLNPYPYVPMHTPPLDEFGRCRGIWVYLRADLCGQNLNEQHAYEKLPFLAARAPCMHECCQTPPPLSPKPMNHVPDDQSIHTPNVTDCQKGPKEDTNNDSEPIVVRVYTKAKVDYSLTIRDRKVILAPSNPSDPLQQWIKDDKFGKNIKDDQGFSSFALVNKATGQAIKHSIGVTYPVQLTDYNPKKLDKSVLWTLGKRLKDGYRAIRAVDNIHLNLDGFEGIPELGGVRDGTQLVLWDWADGDNQKWTIVGYCKLFNTILICNIFAACIAPSY